MKEELKQMVREKVAVNNGLPVPASRPIAGPQAGIVRAPSTLTLPVSRTDSALQVEIVKAAPVAPVAVPDDLIIEITGDSGSATLTLRPFEVSRLRGRFGRGPGFEQWVADRVRDLLVSFGGG